MNFSGTIKKTDKMKKITLLSILALLLCVVSCQISNVDGVLTDEGLKVTAVIDNSDATRVSYAVDNESAFTVTPTWSVGDKIIGFDDKGESFTFTVESLEGDLAILNIGEYALCNCAASKIYAFYVPGSTENDFVEGTLTVDMNPQEGVLNDETKVLMSAIAPIVKGEVTLTFKKETAILGLKKFKLPVTEPTTITSMELVGVPTSCEFSVADDELSFRSGDEPGVITLKGEWTTDAEGVCNTPVYFSVAPIEGANLTVNMSTGSEHFVNVTRIDALDIEPGYYYHMSKILGEPSVAIGDSYFGSLEEAFAAASAISGTPVTIKLLKDCKLTAAATLDNPDGDYILDLNGKTVTTDGLKRIDILSARMTLTDSSAPEVADQGRLTTLESNTNSYILSVHGETGKLIMEAGNIVATGYRATLFTEGGSADLKGGKITAPKAQAVTVGASGGTIDISGSFEAYAPTSNVVRYYGGTGTVSGGKLTNETTSAVIYVDGTSVVKVTGGFFKTTNINTITGIETSRAYVSGGFHSVAVRDVFALDDQEAVYYNVPNPDGATRGEYPYALVPAASNTLIATVTSGSYVWKHASIQSAGQQADLRSANTAATTLKIESDLNSNTTFGFMGAHKYMISVDMNGHSLTSTASPALTSDGPMTILDSGETGEISTTGDIAVLASGDLTVNGGALAGAVIAVAASDTCDLVVNNGYFYGEATDIVSYGGTGSITINGGWFKGQPDPAFLAEGCAASAVEETHLGKTYNYKVAASSVVATVNGTGYASLTAAVAAANSNSDASEEATLILQEDIADASRMTLANPNKPIVFNVNGHRLATNDSILITVTNGTVKIVDTAPVKGIITGPYQKMLVAASNSDVTLEGCVIESNKAEGETLSQMAVYANGSTAKLTINEGTIIKTSHKLTAIRVYNGTLTVNGGEISSGVESEGWYTMVCHSSGKIIINGGSFYTSCTSSNGFNGSPCHIAASEASIEINDGYFYGASRGISSGASSYAKNIVVKGGYFNKNKFSSGITGTLTEINPPVTRFHQTTNQTLEYGFQAQ